MRHLILLCSIVLILSSGCLQISSFQTAKTTPKDEGTIAVALGGLGVTDPFDSGDSFGVGTFEIMGRMGVGEKTDIGLKLSSFSSFLFDVKHQIVGDQHSSFAMALGPSLGFQAFVGTSLLMQAHLPIHMSVHPSDRFAYYLTPRYATQFAFSGGALHYAGGSTGFEIGRKTKFGMDISYMGILNDGDADGDVFEDFGLGLFQVAFGVKFKIGANNNR